MPGGWIEGKPVTALMRQLMCEARGDEGVAVIEGSEKFFAAMILRRWGWLESTRADDVTHIIRLTRRGQTVLDDEQA